MVSLRLYCVHTEHRLTGEGKYVYDDVYVQIIS